MLKIVKKNFCTQTAKQHCDSDIWGNKFYYPYYSLYPFYSLVWIFLFLCSLFNSETFFSLIILCASFSFVIITRKSESIDNSCYSRLAVCLNRNIISFYSSRSKSSRSREFHILLSFLWNNDNNSVWKLTTY